MLIPILFFTMAAASKIFAGHGVSYAISIRLPPQVTHSQAVGIVKQSFSAFGFGLPPGTTDLDMAAVLESKGFACGSCNKYHVLGFCSPPHAARALTVEPAIGVLLPCNVAIASETDDVVEVAAMDPSMMLGLVANKEEMKPLIDEIQSLIKSAMGAVEAASGNVADSQRESESVA
jgi:uncharacterized protein (DUF302 family)